MYWLTMTRLWNWTSLVMHQKVELVLSFLTFIPMVARDQLAMSKDTYWHAATYNKIHEEALVAFALKKFYQFLYGRHFVLVMVYRPLLEPFGPSKGYTSLAVNQWARWIVMLHQYDYSEKPANMGMWMC